MYVSETFGGVEEGFADPFALTGLGIWWVIAAAIAYVGYVKARKAAQAPADPDVEITFEEGQETVQPTHSE
jgi:hypothetical protein